MVKNVSTFSGDSQLPNVRKVIELLTFCLGDQGPFYTIAQQLPQQFTMTCFYVESAKIKAFFFFFPSPQKYVWICTCVLSQKCVLLLSCSSRV